MTEPTTKRAGGCFLMAAILIGFVVGIATGNPLRGVWLGLAAGIVIAVGLWLADRRRG
jgi:UDP-N-acetylmuramyl pentapeptide phosphotransferase/UDP-N-acetylglucosamine-1-phosphate transferase